MATIRIATIGLDERGRFLIHSEVPALDDRALATILRKVALDLDAYKLSLADRIITDAEIQNQQCPHGLHFNGYYCDQCNEIRGVRA